MPSTGVGRGVTIGAKLLLCLAAKPSVGGQAVMEGVMMRNGNRLAIAVRKPSGEIKVETRPWFSFGGRLAKTPFLRGFPILVETLVNGIAALNYSAREALDSETEGEAELGPWAMAGTVAAALGLALGLFVVLPHLVSLAMKGLGWSGGVDSLSFHLWDGLFKLMIFLGYILAISFVPDIRRVFQYHGAEHKTIWAYETGDGLTPEAARGHSRLHPRCGTTFLLFVLGLSIVLYAVLIPLLMQLWSPAGAVARHAYILGVKLVLMVPVSCLAYELIKFAGRFHENLACKAMSAPGMFMQLLTTHEPDDAQLEVAIKALEGAVGPEAHTHVREARKS